MRTEWIETTLGDVIELKRGYDLPSQDRKPGNVPIVTSSGISDYHAEAKVSGPGVVTGRYGTLGNVYYIQEDFWPHNTTLYVRDFKGNDPRFIGYFLRTLQFLSYSDKAAVPGINRNHIHQAIVHLPPLPEQRAIAAVLGALDDKIELNRRMNATLEGLARALFRSWFVDFDPVRAKMGRGGPPWPPSPAPEGRHTPEGNHRGLPRPAAIDALFPDEMEVGEEGVERPRGWRVTSLANYAILNPESWSNHTRPSVIQYVDLSNTKWGKIDSVVSHSAEGAPSRAQRVLRSGDTIVGTVRPGNGSYALIADEGLTGSTGFAVLRPRHPHYREFTYLAATTPENIDILAHLADGGAYPAIRPEVVLSTQVTGPEEIVMLKFSQVTAPLLAKISGNDRESRTLAALRDALLPKLMTGEVRVRQAEEAVTNAL